MKKLNQYGYSIVETALLLVVVGLIAFIAWYVFHTSSNASSTYSNAANTQTEVSKKTTTNTKTPSTEIVTTKTDSKLGKYLADPNNKALYTYGADTSGVSNCSGSCLTNWPIYDATSAPASLPANITVISRDDGGKQYAYKGMPLYYFSSDTVGKVTGDGVNNFHVAKP